MRAPALAAAARSEKPLKAAFSNAGLQATWCAQGKQAAEFWGKLFNVEVTWFDGELDAAKQRAAIDNMASQKWDFVAIQAFGIGTLTDPVKKMIDAGTPVIDMDTLIAPLEQINVHSFLAPDNEFMGASVTQALVDAIGGKGTIIMTQGALGHTGAQGRAKGFESVVKKYPEHRGAGHAAGRLGRDQGGADLGHLLTKYPQIDAAFFHNDDMALAAYNVMKARSRDQHPDRRRRRHAAGDRGGHRRPDARDRAQPVLPHPWRRDRRRAWRRWPAARRPGERHPQARHHRRPGGHQGQRAPACCGCRSIS